jgi:hypothetical protein
LGDVEEISPFKLTGGSIGHTPGLFGAAIAL